MSTQILRKNPAYDAADLVQRCLNGQQNAWDQLVEAYGKLVYAVPTRLGLQQQDAEEVFQAVFLRLFERLPRLRSHDHRSLTAWLTITSRRETWRLIRRKGLDRERCETDGAQGCERTEPDPLEVAMASEQVTLLQRALQLLKPTERRLIKALYLQEGANDYSSIARRLGMPLGSVSPTRGRALTKLRCILGQLMSAESSGSAES